MKGYNLELDRVIFLMKGQNCMVLVENRTKVEVQKKEELSVKIRL